MYILYNRGSSIPPPPSQLSCLRLFPFALGPITAPFRPGCSVFSADLYYKQLYGLLCEVPSNHSMLAHACRNLQWLLRHGFEAKAEAIPSKTTYQHKSPSLPGTSLSPIQISQTCMALVFFATDLLLVLKWIRKLLGNRH